MHDLSPKESRLVAMFLNAFKEMVQERINIPFNPRSLTIISQPDLKDDSRFDSISYNKWFDEMDVQTHIMSSNNIIQASLEIPIHILMDAEDIEKPLVSKKDQKKLLKALKLLSEIRLEKQK